MCIWSLKSSSPTSCKRKRASSTLMTWPQCQVFCQLLLMPRISSYATRCVDCKMRQLIKASIHPSAAKECDCNTLHQGCVSACECNLLYVQSVYGVPSTSAAVSSWTLPLTVCFCTGSLLWHPEWSHAVKSADQVLQAQ